VKSKPLLIGLAGFASGFLLALNNSAAQTSSATTNTWAGGASTVQITTDAGTTFTLTAYEARFSRVGLKPGQRANFTLQFPTSMAGQIITLGALDGGVLTVSNQGQIGTDGTLLMHYQAASAVGAYRIFVGFREFAQMLRFWVCDLANPQNNPPVYPGT
jgi:hypothetical protein